MAMMAPHRSERSGSDPTLVNRTVRIRHGARPLSDVAETRRSYAGIVGPTEVYAVVTVTGGDDRDRQWLVASPARSGEHAAELHPFVEHQPAPKSQAGRLGRHAVQGSAPAREPIARIIPVLDEFDDGRRVVDDEHSVVLIAEEGITLRNLQGLGIPSAHNLQRAFYANPGDGMIGVSNKGDITINTFIDAGVTVIATPESELIEGAKYIR